MNFVKKNWIYITLIFCILIFTFWNLRFSFFEQDEWMALGNIQVFGLNYILDKLQSPIFILLGRGRFLSSILAYFLYKYFPFNGLIYAWLGLVFHFLNAVLVYAISYKLLKNKFYSFIASSFFVVNNVSQGAITWFASIPGTLPATTFVLLSFIFFLKSMGVKKMFNKWVILALFSLYFSMFFKEIGVFFLIIYFGVWLTKGKRISIRSVALGIIFFIAICVVGITGLKGTSLFINLSNNNFISQLISRSIIYPSTSLSLVYIPSHLALEWAQKVGRIFYPSVTGPKYDLLVQTWVLDRLALFLSAIFLFVFCLIYRRDNDKNKSEILVVLAILILSFLPYIVLDKSYSYLESRYYYLASFPSGILLAYIFRKTSFSKIIYLLPVIIIFYHMNMTRNDLSIKVALGQQRVGVMRQLSAIEPNLPKKVVFFVDSGRNYYITEGNPVPFQEGFGYTVLVWYYVNGNRDPEIANLIKDKYLWDLGSEGYKGNKDFGFGYFWNKSELIKTIKSLKLKKENVVYLKYDSLKNNLSRADFSF